ncbi:MAG: hypothetical protein V1818_00860 [Candidatus Aenigmatarchaeota archaeon]
MQTLERQLPKFIRLYEPGVEKIIELPAENLIAVDANIIMSAVLPREKRTLYEFLKHKNRAFLKNHNHSYEKTGGRTLVKEKRNCKKRIKIVNAMEDGYFNNKGLCPIITNKIYAELKYFERLSGATNIDSLIESMEGNFCTVLLQTDYYRRKYPVISESLKEEGDFSIAAVSVELGCPMISDDYISFNTGIQNRIKKEQNKKWPRTNFMLYDSESLAMLLNI